MKKDTLGYPFSLFFIYIDKSCCALAVICGDNVGKGKSGVDTRHTRYLQVHCLAVKNPEISDGGIHNPPVYTT